MKKQSIFLFLIASVLLFGSCSTNINSTEKLVDAIIKKYNSHWFKQVQFEQTTKFYENGEIVRTEKWIEEYRFPSQLLIKIVGESNNNGYLYTNDSIHNFVFFHVINIHT